MRIQKIHLERYKRFFDLTIDLGDDPKRIVALVGPNGCGKSSVFDAMLYKCKNYARLGEHGSRDKKYHFLGLDSEVFDNSVQINLVEGDFDQIMSNNYNDPNRKTILSFRSSFRYNGLLDVKEIRAMPDLRENNFGASTASDIDRRIDQNYRRLNIKYNELLNSEDLRPSEAKERIIGELNSAINNCLNISIDNLGDIGAGKGTIFFRKADTSKVFEYDVLSSGEKEVVDLLLDLYLRKDVYTDTIYIIDEPELHLNTAIQRKLLLEINKMIPPNCQIWIATHSIGFLRALQEELSDDSQVIEFKADNAWASSPYVLTPMIKSCNNWRNLFSTALDDLAGLVSPKRIVYCEGRAEPNSRGEEQGLDAIVYNTVFGAKYPDTLFISSGGNTELDQRSEMAINILSKVFKNVEIWVLKDRDMASGKATSEEDRQTYLRLNSQNHRVLKRFEIENYLFDKEVLKKYCVENALMFDEEAYDKLISDITNQPVKEYVNHIRNFCNIKGSLNPEMFKKRLAEVLDTSMSVYAELEDVIFNRK